MSKGREVADAYIDVHGDLRKFRRSLDKAAVDGRKAGREAADSFSDGWEKRTKSGFLKKWDGVLDAMYSDKKLDWKRLVGTFDATGFEDAAKKIDGFMAEQMKKGKLTEAQYKRVSDAAKTQLGLLAEEEEAVKKIATEQEKARKKQLDDMEALRWQTATNRRVQEQYNDSFSGMFRRNQLKALQRDFERVTLAMNEADWSKWTKGQDDLTKIRDRVREVTDAMFSVGKMTREQGDLIRKSVDEHITAEQRRRRAIKETETATRDAKEATDRWKRSMDGMVFTAELDALEKSWRKITQAMATDDWSGVARGKKNMEDFEKSVRDTTEQMRMMGQVNDRDMDRVNTTLRRVVASSKDFNVNIGAASRGARILDKASAAMSRSWARMDGTVKLVLVAILAAAGPIATILSGISASLAAIVSSVAVAAASIVPLAAGAGAFAAAIFLAITSFDGIRARLPRIQESLDSISNTWTDNAKRFGEAWGESIDSLLNAFATKFGQFDIGTPLGKAFADITKSFEEVINGPGFNAFMEAMTTDLPGAVSGLGRGFAGLFNGLLSLMAGAAPVAKALGEDFARWGTNIAESLEKARESGKLNEVFEKARDSLKSVLDLTGSLGGALGTMFMIGADTGNSLLDSLTKIVDQFNAWMKTENGRAKMLEWFENGERIVRSFEPLAVGLGKALDTLVTPQSIASVEKLMEGLGELLPTVAELLDAFSDLGVLTILTGLLNLIGDLIKPLLPAFDELATIVGDVLAEAIEELSPLFSEVGLALVPVMELLAELAKEILPPLIPLIAKVVEFAIKLIPLLGEVLQFAAEAVGVVGDIVKAILELEGIGTIIESLGTMVEGAINLIVGLLTGDWDRAFSGAGQVAEGFGGVFVGVWEIIEEVVGWITEAFNLFWQITQEVFGNVGTFFSDTWNNISTTTKEIWGNIETFFSDTWENITGGVEEAWGGLTESVGGFLGDIDTNVREKLDGFWNKFDEVFPGTRALAEEEWGKMKTTIGNLVMDTKNDVDTKWGEMKTNAATKFSEIKSNTETKWEEISSATKTKWEEIKKTVTDKATEIVGPVRDKWEEIKKTTSDKWGEIKDTVSTKWNEMLGKTRETATNIQNRAGEMGNSVRDRIMGPVNNLRAQWDNGWNIIRQVFSTTWERIKQGAITGAQNLMNTIIQLPGRILNGLISLPGRMRDAGVQMIMGMVGGIGEAAHNIVNAAVAAASNAVQAVKNFLGIKSPSRLFMGIGEFMGEGMAIGMDHTRSAVASAAVQLADAAMGEFAVDRMYATGKHAAEGLAEGLLANKSALQSALGEMTPTVGEFAAKVRPGSSSAGDAATETDSSGRSIVVESGAIRIDTNVSDPALAAEMVLDELISNTNL